MIARAYVENGAKSISPPGRADACEALAKELSQFGECIAIPADLSRMEEIARLSSELHKRRRSSYSGQQCRRKLGRDLRRVPRKRVDKVMDLNVKSVFFLTQSLLDLLEAADRRIPIRG